MSDEKTDIIYGTETWLHQHLHNSELLLGDYDIYRNDRPDELKSKMSGGGVMLAIKKNSRQRADPNKPQH